MNPAKTQEHGFKTRLLKNTRQLFYATGAWVLTCFLMSIGPQVVWHNNPVPTVIAVGLNFCVGVGLILVHKKYLASLDELQRKIYLDALGITVGMVFIVITPYSILDTYNIIHLKTGIEVTALMFLMSVTFVASMAYGNWRYR